MSETASASGPPEPAGHFPTTHWTLVLEAARGETGRSAEALGRLCVLYRDAICGWLRRSGAPLDTIEDRAQRFIEHLLEANRLKNVERRETKFRTYLIECLRRLTRGEWRKEMAAKRGGGSPFSELSETLPALLNLNLEQLLDQEFAWTVHRQALARLELGKSNSEARRRRFEQLQQFILGHDPDVSYHDVGNRLGMTANHVKKAVFDLRQDYYDAFREVVARTVVPESVDEETRYLMTLVARGVAGEQPPSI
jgi:DNA-directed RNA polymerase specialized sigma24 family protein